MTGNPFACPECENPPVGDLTTLGYGPTQNTDCTHCGTPLIRDVRYDGPDNGIAWRRRRGGDVKAVVVASWTS